MVFVIVAWAWLNVSMENLLTKYYGHLHRAVAVGVKEIEIQDLV